MLALNLPEKHRIRQSFDQAALRYDHYADFQRQVATRLADWVPKSAGELALDIGTGTGFGSTLLVQQGWHPIGLDFSSAMLRQAKQRGLSHWRGVQADAEALPFQDESLSLIYSSLALQWCQDLSRPFAEAYRVLKPGGRFVCAVLLDGSLHELKTAWQQIDSHQHVNDFFTLNQVNFALAQKQIVQSQLICEPVVCRYATARALMQDLKGIGASQIASHARQRLTKGTLLQLEHAYQQYFSEDGALRATYQVGLIEVRK
ncbi:Malonyl-[acyl-carrier protein] O-methyltransferase [Vibrio stylophorae]|uniref:Malonyl-[acyl-carrier protein] O-methyltransferase n=1 Tax=Vibrio stylophorae TaxID=659351 RepID=A0ABN8DQH4_9VIBR|nr:malonyl-ACP O-methyltransferase BioC [Vibrio stylophorae]CAH0533424.1 Malonyl-[acyl-carrier protein] O-methyltransferase [Vibrio stylophorae]